MKDCVLVFKDNRADHLPLIKYSYKNGYHASFEIALVESLYGKWYRSLAGLFEIGKMTLIGHHLVLDALEKVKYIFGKRNYRKN